LSTFFIPPERKEPDALLGFVVSTVPSVLTDRQSSLLHLINALWGSGVTAIDLRLARTPPAPGVSIYLLCRFRRLPQVASQSFHGYCLAAASRLQQLFHQGGFELRSLPDEASFSQAMAPFQVRVLAEIRREEEIFLIRDRAAFTNYDVYVTYPWEWLCASPMPFIEILSQQQSPCLVSIHLEPTQLNELERAYLGRATAAYLQEKLWSEGAKGANAADIYRAFASKLERPYLLRVSLAASAKPDVTHPGQTFLARLQTASSAPILQFPQDKTQQQSAWRNFFNLEWLPWGNLRDHTPDSARLRYLVDSQGASMAFQLPKTEEQRVVILTALPVEYQAVRVHISELREETHQGTVYERGIFIAEKRRWEVVIAQIGMGGTGAAADATRAIEHFKPRVILFVGVAGGIKDKDVALSDVVVATKVYGYESGKLEAQGFRSRPEVGQSSFSMVQRARAEARKRAWSQRIQRSAAPMVAAPRVFVGPIAAGEKVIASTDTELYHFLRTTYEDALAIEMESHGFLQATYRDPTILALIVRGISDLIDGKRLSDGLNYQEIAAGHASAFAFEVLAKLDL